MSRKEDANKISQRVVCLINRCIKINQYMLESGICQKCSTLKEMSDPAVSNAVFSDPSVSNNACVADGEVGLK